MRDNNIRVSILNRGADCDELIFIRATASPDQLELLAGAVL